MDYVALGKFSMKHCHSLHIDMKKTQPIEGKGMRNSVLKVNVVG